MRDREEAWIDKDLVRNLVLRCMVRKQDIRDIFVAQLEYEDAKKNNVILRWDASHKIYHLDKKGKKYKYYFGANSLNRQIEIVFKELSSNIDNLLSDNKYVLGLINEEKKDYLKELEKRHKEIKRVYISYGKRNYNQFVKNEVSVKDQVIIELYDKERKLKDRRLV